MAEKHSDLKRIDPTDAERFGEFRDAAFSCSVPMFKFGPDGSFRETGEGIHFSDLMTHREVLICLTQVFYARKTDTRDGAYGG